MNTLRAKIALLLVVAIVSVVGIMTAVFLHLYAPPPPRRTIEPVAQTIELLARQAENGNGGIAFSPRMAKGQIDSELTSLLRSSLAKRNLSIEATISRDGQEHPLTVSIPIDTRGWFIMPISDLPPPLSGLMVWLALITFGATAIAVLVAHRMVQPLAILERAVASVGHTAILPELPEEGPAEVRAMVRALNSLSTRLKAAVESRMRLVAAAGHDFRTPITRLRLRAEFVENDDERTLWLRDLEELERIADSAIQLVREESDTTPAQKIALDELVTEIVSELREQHYDARITDLAPATVRTGKLALSRALRNLIINAATHGVGARVSICGGSETTVCVVISDDGPGIPEELIGRVFEPFFRADPARRQSIPGAGLGLTIAYEIINRAGGEISIKNCANGGLVQIVKLPVFAPS